MLLRQLSSGDPITILGLEGLERGCPFLRDAEWRDRPADLERKEKKQGAGGGSTITRALNADNTPITYTPDYINVAKKIISRDIKVDKVVEDRNEDPEARLAERSREELFYVGQLMQAMFITGDSASVATDFDGVENIVATYGRTLTASKTVPVGGDTVKALQQAAIEKLLEHAENVVTFHPDGFVHAYMNGALKVRILSVAKALGYLESVQRPDASGVDRILGEKIIIRSAGMNASGSYLLPFTETANGGNSSSIWFMSWDEMGIGCHMLTSVGLKGEYNGRVGNFYQNNYNLDAALGCRNTNALVRSTGWKLED